ncbi:RNA-directed DNA polymerase, eukaryota [Tanacetum coccineum]
MGAHNQNSLQSKADQTVRISKSVFVSNFPEGCTAKDLWKVCNDYGTVVDVFIPTKKSKVGKRFAFVRFIKVINLDRLIENLNTIWIGRFYLFANPARFERPKKPNLSSHNNVVAAPSYPQGVDQAKGQFQTGSYVNVVNGSSPAAVNGVWNTPVSASPAMVLDDSCVVSRDLGNYVMGEVKQFSSINTLHVILSNEGFPNANVVYLGGLWVMIELTSSKSKAKFLKHVGVASWFNCLSNAQSDFVSRDRIVWVDIEGVPMHVWSSTTFHKIGSKWGEEDNILEKFKIIVKEKIFVVRAKELFTWSPTFTDVSETAYCSDDDSDKEVGVKQSEFCKQGNSEDESDNEAVSDTFYGENTNEEDITGTDSSIPFPPGFTPDKGMANEVEQDMQAYGNGLKHKEGGSILEVLEEMIKVGQTMGFSMEVCNKDMEKIIGSQGVHEHHIISDNFVALCGNWIPIQKKILMISVYAPLAVSNKRVLWTYLTSLINRWNGESIVMGDFNEVRWMEERWGSNFNVNGARAFNNFISNSGLVDLQLEGYTFTWAHPSATKMSKLDRFLMTDGLLSLFPHVSAACLDRHLSDHRPILLREVFTDYGATPFRFYHSWFSFQGFEHMVTNTWNSTILNDSNRMIRFKKKLQILKKEIRMYVADYKKKQLAHVNDLKSKLSDIDRILDQGRVNDDLLLSRTECMNNLQDVKAVDARDSIQKAKIQWAVEGDENSKFFHGIVNRK